MPFIDSELLLNEKTQIQRILITSADDCDVRKISFEIARLWAEKGASVLWVDGNLGEHSLKEKPCDAALDKVLKGQIPLSEILKKREGICVLEGSSECYFAELSEEAQYQFLQDLKNIYTNFDKVVLAVDGKNIALQKKWQLQAENIYLLFNCQNLLLNRTLTWLKENKAKGVIGIGKNEQEVLLTYMRLKKILGDVPDLILDIKKIAP